MASHPHRRAVAAPWRASGLTLSAGARLALAMPVLGGLWAIVLWAMRP